MNAMTTDSLDHARQVVEFWTAAGPEQWFAANPEFDRVFAETFAIDYAAAAGGQLGHWLHTAEAALALVILLDQYPRNSFRGTLWMYTTDTAARIVADIAISKGFDWQFEGMLPLFFYLPFGHSETLVDQERAAALCERFGEPALSHSVRHMNIIKRFGRFPHRNTLLGRKMRAEEQDYLDNGGFAG
jgi:uncharacterized protein (DUF924 family)